MRETLALMLLSVQPAALLLMPSVLPVRRCSRHPIVMMGASTVENTHDSTIVPRRPYLLSGLPRPRYRGALMGWLHRTRLWYLLAVTYVAAALWLSSRGSVPLTKFSVALRFLAAAVTSANIYISDAYHNADKKGPAVYTREHELQWMRRDYIGISAILAYNQWLWSCNVGWAGFARLASVHSGLCLAVVSALAPQLSGDRDGYGKGSTKVVKYITGTQFLPSLTYLVLTFPVAGGRNALIYTVYGFGLVLYLAKQPKSHVHGFHEWFHLMVVLGHLSSMGFDLFDIIAPCARVAGPTTTHAAAPFNHSMLPWVLLPWMMLLVLLPNKRRISTKFSGILGTGQGR